MEKYDPERLELSTRDLVSRAILQEVRAGNASPAGGVYLDLTFNAPGYIAKMTPSLYATYRNLGLDPEKDLLEVAPTAHFFMGGMEVDASWQSRVPGLFGAGEVCGGMHGGNRLSQNALAEILVSGLIAGKNAASLAAGTAKRRLSPKETLPEKQRLREILKIKTGIAPLEAINALKKLMWEYAGVIRSGRSLERAVSGLAELAARPVKISGKSLLMNREVAEVLELDSMLASARCVVLSALERKESRAAHFREDYPEADNETRPQTIIIQGYGDRLATERRPAETPDETPGDPERIAAENIRSVPREFICESLPQACRKTDSLLRKAAILSAKNLVPPDKILVSRFDPETDREPYWKEYAVAVERGMTVLDLLLRIREEQDPTLAHSYCCRNVCCGLCGLTVNGTSALACRRAAEPGMRLAPLAAFPVLRDLVVQRDSYEQLRPALRLFPERTDRAEREPESIDMAAFDNFKSASRCVECLCCVSSCPVYLKDRHNFAGPAALILEARHYFDPRDRLDRAQILKSAGLGLCTGCGRCTEVCALGVDPAALIGKMKLSTGLSRPLSPQKN
jgi:succinate dehydrogenase/fumarate reductase iron-sulfur protein